MKVGSLYLHSSTVISCFVLTFRRPTTQQLTPHWYWIHCLSPFTVQRYEKKLKYPNFWAIFNKIKRFKGEDSVDSSPDLHYNKYTLMNSCLL